MLEANREIREDIPVSLRLGPHHETIPDPGP